ncbi:MAG: 50S ribosomal protein L17 [Planctomycetes bacterium]|nr:50S ribosomal protein L17 [Planctomycetota bacterium]
MRHRMRGRRLGRSTKHRTALGRNLVAALIEHGRITTTLPKAKQYRPMAEHLITLAKQKTLHRIRRAQVDIRRRDLLARLFDEIGPSFRERPGGYTRIVRLPGKRLGDKGQKCFLELVNHVPVHKATPEEAKGAGKDKAPPAEPAAKADKAPKAKASRAAGG